MLNARPRIVLALALAAGIPALIAAQQRGRADNPFPGGANPDGSLRPTPPLTRLFTQDAYTEYEILKPGSEEFRIKFLPEETRVGATELVNATRGGSEGSGVEVYDPRTGKPLTFTYQQEGSDPDNHAIHAKLSIPVPAGRRRPRPHLQDLQGSPHLHDARRRRGLGAQPERLPSGRAAAEGVRLHLLERRGAAHHIIRRSAAAGVREPERAEQPGHHPRAENDRDVPAARRHRHVLRRCQDALRPGDAGERARQGRPELQRLSQRRPRPARHARTAAAAGAQGDRPGYRRSRSRPRRTAPPPSSNSTCRSSTTSRARTSRSPGRSAIPATRCWETS